MSEKSFDEVRRLMVQLVALHVAHARKSTGRESLSPGVMEAMAEVPRHEFVPEELRRFAYSDGPLPIGHDKTISQPFIVALMADLLELDPEHRVLEVGTGLGYQAAVLSRLAGQVYSMDIIAELATEAAERLATQGYGNVEVRIGNGVYGWRDHSPFDRIVLAAAPESIPPALVDQLGAGGRMVLPVGPVDAQNLVVVEKGRGGELETTEVLPVRFAPLVVVH